MKHRLATITIAMLTFAAIAAPTFADTAASVRKTLQAKYDKANQAFDAKDLRTAFIDYAPNCTFVGDNGSTMSATDLYNSLYGLFAAAKTCSDRTKILTCTLGKSNGYETATVIVSDDQTIVYHGADGKLTSLRLAGKSRHYWAKFPEGWKILQGYTLDENEWVDGHKTAPEHIFG